MNDTIRKIVIPVAAIAAIGYGGAQFASAQNESTKPAATTQSEAAEAPGTETADGPDKGDGDGDGHGNDAVTGAAATKATAAALAKVPGKVTEVSSEHADADAADAADKTDVPEPGDTPDPAYEAQIAYDVEVTKADGSVVDVELDKSFAVLGTQAGEQQDGPDGDQDHGGKHDD